MFTGMYLFIFVFKIWMLDIEQREAGLLYCID
jgi:hypothetical protein